MERFETGLIEPRDFVEQLSRLLDLRMDYDQFCEIWSSIFTETLIPESHAGGPGARATAWCCSPTPTPSISR